ncbi:MAG: hypothetical protein ACOH18_01230 [Candidatus Saccharimonadaceae bacterium]
MSGKREDGRWLKKRQTEFSVDRLEGAPLPPRIEDAGAEYLADMAFDDRLLSKLEKNGTLVKSRFSNTITTHKEGIVSQHFAENDFVPNEVILDDDTIEIIKEGALSYIVEGEIRQQPGSLFVDFSVSSDDEADLRLHVQSADDTPDVYFLTGTQKGVLRDVDVIDSNELFKLVCQLGRIFENIDNDAYLRMLEMFSNDTSIAQNNIVKLWEQIAETYGQKTATTELTCEVTIPANPSHPEHIKLVYTETEDMESSKIELHLSHTTDMPEFDVQESHHLRLLFESSKDDTLCQKDAQKVINSGYMHLTGIQASTVSRGHVTELDLATSPIIELFVDWFDEVVSEL